MAKAEKDPLRFRGVNASLDVDELVTLLTGAVTRFQEPVVTQMSRESRDPFLVLIATVLSLRTRDEQTRDAANRLFALAHEPRTLLDLPTQTIEKAIFPVGFYRVKAHSIQAICKELLTRYDGRVPDDLDELLTLPGVGRKTANLVLTRGFGLPGICVDTHVHRICNRLGYLKTRSPEETEMELRRVLPLRHWIPLNDLLVAYGQNLCTPLSPWCSRCDVAHLCARTGVERKR